MNIKPRPHAAALVAVFMLGLFLGDAFQSYALNKGETVVDNWSVLFIFGGGITIIVAIVGVALAVASGIGGRRR